jgi:hypothetical protein
MYMDAGLAAAVTALRTAADLAHLAHVLVQFRLAYVSRDSLVVGCGKLVWDPRAIAAHYARSAKGLWFDLFVILPIPQVSSPHLTSFHFTARISTILHHGIQPSIDRTQPLEHDMPCLSR